MYVQQHGALLENTPHAHTHTALRGNDMQIIISEIHTAKNFGTHICVTDGKHVVEGRR